MKKISQQRKGLKMSKTRRQAQESDDMQTNKAENRQEPPEVEEWENVPMKASREIMTLSKSWF